MNYREYLDSLTAVHADLAKRPIFKMLTDLASLLDSTLLELEPEGENSSIVEAREKVYDAFCAVCQQAELPLPPMERLLLCRILNSGKFKQEQVDRAQNIRFKVDNIATGLRDNAETRDLVTLARILTIFPQMVGSNDSWNKISFRQVMAGINLHLMDADAEPIRPEYTLAGLKTSNLDAKGLKEPIKVVIIDDRISDLVDTALALAGWPGLEVVMILQHSEKWEIKGDELAGELWAWAQMIMKEEPDIVLMDQGLFGFCGSDLVRYMIQALDNPPLFVGNTGGLPDELNEAGARDNFNKGKSGPDAIRSAISRLDYYRSRQARE